MAEDFLRIQNVSKLYAGVQAVSYTHLSAGTTKTDLHVQIIIFFIKFNVPV